MSCSREKRYQALPALPYYKRRKAGRGLGTRLGEAQSLVARIHVYCVPQLGYATADLVVGEPTVSSGVLNRWSSVSPHPIHLTMTSFTWWMRPCLAYFSASGEARQHPFPSTLCNHSLKRHLYETSCVFVWNINTKLANGSPTYLYPEMFI